MDRTKKNTFTDEPIDELDIIEEIESKGTIYIAHQWVPIDTVVQVYKETDKAYFGNVIVCECDSIGRVNELYKKGKEVDVNGDLI